MNAIAKTTHKERQLHFVSFGASQCYLPSDSRFCCCLMSFSNTREFFCHYILYMFFSILGTKPEISGGWPMKDKVNLG